MTILEDRIANQKPYSRPEGIQAVRGLADAFALGVVEFMQEGSSLQLLAFFSRFHVSFSSSKE